MNFNLVCAILFSILLIGCFAPPVSPPAPIQIDWNNPIETKNRVVIEKDDFEKMVKYKGPIMKINISEVEVQNLNFRSITSLKTGKTLFQIYTYNGYRDNGWRFYDRAYDSEGNKLSITLISKDLKCSSLGCKYMEEVAVNLTRDYLEKHSETGIKYKISGKGGSGIFFVPAGYIKGFLAVVPK